LKIVHISDIHIRNLKYHEEYRKVFENLLEVKNRKSKGTYYTPREIVHYMCEQSLLNYLATEFEG